MDEPLNASQLIDELNRQFQTYNNRFGEQFHLQIPKNTIRTVHYYRDTYFSYLKDSIYKSNICYLLQLIDYQLWLYKLFSPKLSLENSYFYQLMVTMGIAAEAVATVILIDPLLTSDPKDRSLGDAATQHEKLTETLVKNSFLNNIKIIESLEILSPELVEKYQQIRQKLRNKVHIQNWGERLYESITFDDFKQNLVLFRKFLLELKEQISLTHTPEGLQKILLSEIDESRRYTGMIVQFNSSGGFGFIESPEFARQIYFHVSQLEGKEQSIAENVPVKFSLKKGRKGPEGAKVVLN